MIRLGCNDSLPKDWVWAKANDLMDVRDGTHDSPKAQTTGIPLVTSKNLVNGKIDYSTCTYISEEDHESISKRSAVDDGDILYAMIGTIGNPVIVKKDFDFSIKNVALFKFTKTDLSNRYIYHYLNSGLAKQQFESNSRGGTQKFVSLGNIRELIIPLPPIEEQKRIAAILDKADAIRRKRQQAIKLADDFLRSVFLDMFGDPVTNPKGWEVKSLGSLIESGPTNGLYKPSTEYGSGIRILRIDGFYNGVLSPQEKLKRVNLGQNEIEKYQLKDRSILINRVNSRDYLGKSAFVERLEEVTVFESNMMNFSANEEIINPCFLVHQLQTPYIKNQVLKLAKDAVNQSSINQQDVKSLEVIVPNLELQTEFELVCTRYKDSLTTRKKSIFNCEAIFSSLGQRAFSGEL